MVNGSLGMLDALMVALSGFVIVFLMLALLWGLILVISRAIAGIERHPQPVHHPAAAPSAPLSNGAPAAPAAVPVALEGVDELQAACIMAIVSHQTGIPLEQLVFRSIKAL